MSPFEVLFNDQPLARMISFDAVASNFRITIGTELEPSINVHLNYSTSIIFKQYGEGIYYFDTTNEDFLEDESTDYTIPNIVDSNKSCFHRREIKGSD